MILVGMLAKFSKTIWREQERWLSGTSTCCPYIGLTDCGYQHLHGGSHLSVTPVTGNLMLFAGLFGHCMYKVHIHPSIHAGKH